jgi:methylated-DNA-protein-cysteine methyltransferase-like protein
MDSSGFYQEVYAVVRMIPRGMVMSYGGVARQCGRPGRARAVGYALHAAPTKARIPWWRVINAQGRLSIPDNETSFTQRSRLIAEGVHVSDDLRVDMRAYDAEMIVYDKLRMKRDK